MRHLQEIELVVPTILQSFSFTLYESCTCPLIQTFCASPNSFQPAKTSLSPRSSPLGTFHTEEPPRNVPSGEERGANGFFRRLNCLHLRADCRLCNTSLKPLTTKIQCYTVLIYLPWVPEVFSRVRRGASSATGRRHERQEALWRKLNNLKVYLAAMKKFTFQKSSK